MACFPFCNLLGDVASFKGGKNPEWPGEPTQPPIQEEPGNSFPGVKAAGV